MLNSNSFINRRGQGALEYLLIIGGAILIAAIVIAVLLSSSTQARDDANTNLEQVDTVSQRGNELINEYLGNTANNNNNDNTNNSLQNADIIPVLSLLEGNNSSCVARNNGPENITSGSFKLVLSIYSAGGSAEVDLEEISSLAVNNNSIAVTYNYSNDISDCLECGIRCEIEDVSGFNDTNLVNNVVREGIVQLSPSEPNYEDILFDGSFESYTKGFVGFPATIYAMDYLNYNTIDKNSDEISLDVFSSYLGSPYNQSYLSLLSLTQTSTLISYYLDLLSKKGSFSFSTNRVKILSENSHSGSKHIDINYGSGSNLTYSFPKVSNEVDYNVSFYYKGSGSVNTGSTTDLNNTNWTYYNSVIRVPANTTKTITFNPSSNQSLKLDNLSIKYDADIISGGTFDFQKRDSYTPIGVNLFTDGNFDGADSFANLDWNNYASVYPNLGGVRTSSADSSFFKNTLNGGSTDYHLWSSSPTKDICYYFAKPVSQERYNFTIKHKGPIIVIDNTTGTDKNQSGWNRVTGGSATSYQYNVNSNNFPARVCVRYNSQFKVDNPTYADTDHLELYDLNLVRIS